MCHALLKDLRSAPGLLVELDPRVAVALPEALLRDHQVGPHSLRACVTAPNPSRDRCGKKQNERCQHQQSCNEVEFLRPDLEKEDEKSVVCHVEEYGLVRQVGSPAPAQPGQDIVDAQRNRHHYPLYIAECAGCSLWMDLLTCRVKFTRFAPIDRRNIQAWDPGRCRRTINTDKVGWLKRGHSSRHVRSFLRIQPAPYLPPPKLCTYNASDLIVTGSRRVLHAGIMPPRPVRMLSTT